MLLGYNNNTRPSGHTSISSLIMSYFTWKEAGLTSDCTSLESMASRFEESAKLMRKMAKEGFMLEKRIDKQLITHKNPQTFESWGFINEEPPFRQLRCIEDNPESSKN